MNSPAAFPHKRLFTLACFWALSSGLLSASGLLGLGASSEVEQVDNSGQAPESAPDTVWVASFATSMAEVETDPGGPLKRRQARMDTSDDGGEPETIRGALRESIGGLLGGIRGGDDTSMVGDDAATVASKSASLLQSDLVKALNKAGIPAQAWTDGSSWPSSGIMIDGQFLTIDEGSQIRRMAIGLGAGESYLNTQVQVYELGDPEAAPFLVFHTDGDSGMAPGLLVGGAVGKAVTSSAAVGAGVSGFRGSKKGTPDDLKNTASSISTYLKGFWQKQGWLAASGD